jgi:hypothetical protein
MKQTLALVFIVMFTLTSCTSQNWWRTERGEGPVTKRTIELDDFDGVSLAFSGDVYLQQGNTQKVEVEMQESLFEYLNTDIRSGVWRIKFDRNVRTRQRMKVYITIPDLKEVSVSGSGSIVSENTFTNLGDLDIAVSGSGDIKMSMEGEDVKVGVSGSGDITLEGSADDVSIRISGSGDIRAHELAAKTGSVSISGSGDVTIWAADDLEVRTSGSGDVAYKGRPRLSAKTSGSGDVESMR